MTSAFTDDRINNGILVDYGEIRDDGCFLLLIKNDRGRSGNSNIFVVPLNSLTRRSIRSKSNVQRRHLEVVLDDEQSNDEDVRSLRLVEDGDAAAAPDSSNLETLAGGPGGQMIEMQVEEHFAKEETLAKTYRQAGSQK